MNEEKKKTRKKGNRKKKKKKPSLVPGAWRGRNPFNVGLFKSPRMIFPRQDMESPFHPSLQRIAFPP